MLLLNGEAAEQNEAPQAQVDPDNAFDGVTITSSTIKPGTYLNREKKVIVAIQECIVLPVTPKEIKFIAQYLTWKYFGYGLNKTGQTGMLIPSLCFLYPSWKGGPLWR